MFNKDRKTIQLIKGRKNIVEILFSIALVLELIVMMTDHMASWTLPYRGRVTHVAFVFLCLKILFTEYDYKQVVLVLLSGVLGVISYITCGDEYVIRAIVFVAAGLGIDFKRNLKIMLWGTLIGTLMIISLALLGICGDIADVRHYGRGIVETRYCLGFSHANNVHCMLWYIISLLVILKSDSLKNIHYISLLAMNVGLYFLTASRTGLLATAAVIVLSAVIKQYNNQRIRLSYLAIAVLSFATCITLSLRSAYTWPLYSEFLEKLDGMLTGRLEMVWEHMPMNSWVMFPGSRISEYVDNGFVSITYIYGTVVGLLFCSMIIYIIYESYKKNKMDLMIILISSILVIFMESTYIINVSLLCNMVLLLCVGINNYE